MWEAILVNDGSTDQTEEILLEYTKKDSRFRLITIKNSGVSEARNKGILSAKGEFVQLLDSDDLIGKRKLEAQLEQLKANDDVDIVYSGARYFKENMNELYLYGRNGLFPTVEFTVFDTQLLEVVKLRNPFVTPAPLYRKSVFDKIGLYDSNLNYLEDWDFQIRCVLNNLKFQYYTFTPHIGSFIRLRKGSLMDNRKEVILAKKCLYSKYPALFSDQLELLKKSSFLSRVKAFLKF